MMNVKREYSLTELAEETGVPVRTVRYYIAQGILDGPRGRGKAATYSHDHLLRLKAARELAEQRVPLEEIKRVVPALSEPQLEDLIGRTQTQRKTEAEAKRRSPRDYVAALLDRHQLRRTTEIFEAEERSPFEVGKLTPYVEESSAPYPGEEETETWRRIPLARGVELHIAETQFAHYEPLIERLRTLIRRKV